VASVAVEVQQGSGVRTGGQTAVGPRRSAAPIKWWVAAGSLHFTVAAYILVRWLTSGQVHRTHPGPTPMPDSVRIAVDIATWASPALGLGIVYWFLVRPLIQRRGLTTEGMLLIACLCLYFPYDIVNDYTANLFQYNSHFWNAGSWLGAIPGTLLPNAYKVPEPIFFMLPAYAWGVFAPAMVGAWCMRRLRQRMPRLSNLQLVVVVLVAMAVIDLVLEGAVSRLQIEGYPGTSRTAALGGGTSHQFPAYETLLIGLIYIGGAALLFFRDDKGRTFAERGVDRIETTARRRTALRLLATIGFMVTVEFFAFDIPIQWFAAHGGAFPANEPSYLVNGVCGPGTGYPCPGPHTPIYKPNSIAVPTTR
jgi:hypothetical protein